MPFVRVVPEEIERYGFAGAVFVAHIRFRCATDGPGRFVVDGVRWWRVTLADLAAELCVSKDVAQRTMKRLGDAVSAKRFGPPSDQTLAYRVAVAATCQNAESHRLDLPERGIAPVDNDRRDIASVPTRNRTGTDAISRSVPLLGEGEEGGRSGRVDSSTTAATAPANSEPATPEPDPFRDDPPEHFPEANNQPATPEYDPFDYPDDDGPDGASADGDASPTPAELAAAAELPVHPDDRPAFTEPEPSRYCPDHPNDTDERCGACGDARRARKAWDERREAAAAAAKAGRRAWIAACRQCDPSGWRLGPDRAPVDPAVRCNHEHLLRVYAARHDAFTIPSRRAAS